MDSAEAGNKQGMTDPMGRLYEVSRDDHEDDEMTVDRQTTSREPKDWNWLMRLTRIANVQGSLDARSKSAEVACLNDVGELAVQIDSRTGRA